MGTHVDALIGQELGRTHLVEKDKRADHLALERGKRLRTSISPRSTARGTISISMGVGACAVTGNGIRAGAPAHNIVLRCMLNPFCSLGRQCDVTRARVSEPRLSL